MGDVWVEINRYPVPDNFCGFYCTYIITDDSTMHWLRQEGDWKASTYLQPGSVTRSMFKIIHACMYMISIRVNQRWPLRLHKYGCISFLLFQPIKNWPSVQHCIDLFYFTVVVVHYQNYKTLYMLYRDLYVYMSSTQPIQQVSSSKFGIAIVTWHKCLQYFEEEKKIFEEKN